MSSPSRTPVRRVRGGSTRWTSTSRLNLSIESGASSPGVANETQPLFPAAAAKEQVAYAVIDEVKSVPPARPVPSRPARVQDDTPSSAFTSSLIALKAAGKGARAVGAPPPLRNRDVFPRGAKAYILNPKVRRLLLIVA